MRIGRMFAVSAAAAVAMSAGAQAATLKSLEFTGVVSPGAYGFTHPAGSFCDEEPQCGTVSFAGQPITISMALSQTSEGYYASQFYVSWSNQTYDLPYLTRWYDQGFPFGEMLDVTTIGVWSTLYLDQSGGSSSEWATAGHAMLEQDLVLWFNFTFDQPRNPFATYTDVPITGSGHFDAWSRYETEEYTWGNFTLTSVSAAATPEPATWGLMILGFGATGALLRRRRERRASTRLAAAGPLAS